MAAPPSSAPPPPPCSPETADAFLSRPHGDLAAVTRDWNGPILVLGAGGKMGLHLCLMLRQVCAQPVIAVSRFQSHRDRAEFTRQGVETVACDLAEPDQLARLPDADVVFFLAGVKFGTTTAPELLHRINVEVPQRVATRYRGSRIIALSTGCVYPFVSVDSSGATEATPPAPLGAYAESCLQREHAFAAAAAADPATRVVLIRLNYAVEFRYGVLVDVGGRVLRGEPVDVTMGHVNLIWQSDALEAVIRAATLAGSPARPLNVTGAGVLRVRDLAEDFGRRFGRSPVITGREAPTAWLNDASESHRRWGVPATSLATMQEWVAGWLAAGYPTWGKPTGFEKRDGQF